MQILKDKGQGCSSVVEYLSTTDEALSSNQDPRTANKIVVIIYEAVHSGNR